MVLGESEVMEYRYDIQGLRALAVLLVFLFHLNSNFLSGGFVGVDIFFVISGYLVSRIILNSIDSDNRHFKFVDFYLGRFRRLLPVYFIFLIVTLVVGLLVYLSIDISTLRKNVFWSSIFNSNYFLATIDDYFGAKSSENPLLHTWTLSIEMQFYFLLPIYLKLVKRKYLVILSIIIIIFLISYSYYNSTFIQNKSAMYFSLLSRIPEFLIGVVFGLMSQNIVSSCGKYSNFITWFAFGLILLSSIFFSEVLNFPGIIVLIPCLATGMLLCFPNSTFNKQILSNKVLVRIGEISYSVYLWHWMVMAFLRYYNNRYSFTLLESLIIIMSTYVLSVVSYKFIEVKYRKVENKKALIIYGTSFVLLICVFFLAPRLNKLLLNVPEKYSSPTFGLESHAASFKEVQFIGDVQKPSDSILLIGDSHALVYKSMLDEIGIKEKMNFRTLSNDRYPNIPNIERKDFLNSKLYDQYSKLVKITCDEIAKSNIIIISSIWLDQIHSLPFALESFVKKNPNKIFIVLGDFPTLDKNPIKINRSFIKNSIKDNIYNVALKDLPNYVTEIAEKYPNCYVIKFKYENGIKIAPFHNDTVMYYDMGHLNDYGARIMARDLEGNLIQKIKNIKK